MRVRRPETHRNRRLLFRTLSVVFLCIALYDLYISNVLAALSMMFCCLSFQGLAEQSVLEEKIDTLMIANTDTISE